ncbi:hypothetical protein K1T71_009490 [Dendrolimus kikuchii]|uniref:Uncharacterized protein n=1 Tax=Dendrolimus kikuchii TaxID=765133 RepID=A0ACC1CUI8_9NEOP|nr:hypothetical protein K1T71_009490 [Dendrolimus kikuchii]
MDQELKNTADFAILLDNNDPIGHFRKRFYIKKGVIYLCGNSLGLASKDAEEHLEDVVIKWKEEGVKIWAVDDSKYLQYASKLSELMAPLVGANADEITIVGCTTLSIHQAICTLYEPTKFRYKILVDDLNFPTDRYAVDGQVRLKGFDPKDAVKVIKSRDGKFIDENDIIDGITDDVALILLPTVLYRSAQVLDMQKVTKAAKKSGVIIGWDLCHAVGAIEIDLKTIDADFAIWCTYKYLNGGPGSPAALYMNRRHFKKLPGLAGWYGNKLQTQFLLRQEFEHEQSASGLQIGTPTLFSMAPLEGALKIFNEAGIKNIRKKSLHITGYLMYLIETKLVQYRFSIGNHKDDAKRGGHICLEHDEAFRISVALKSKNVVVDFREPNVIRLTPAALYISYQEMYDLVDILEDIMKKELYKQFSNLKDGVV